MTDSRAPQMARMPWYPRDFRSSTLGWPLVARGIYRELLDAQWDSGGLPPDERGLRGIAGATPAEWRAAWPYVEPKFPQGADGLRRNPRLEQHRDKAVSLSRTNAGRARQAARSRWDREKAPTPDPPKPNGEGASVDDEFPF